MKGFWIVALLVLVAGCEQANTATPTAATAPTAPVPLAAVKSNAPVDKKAPDGEKAPDGKSVFLSQCIACHCAESAGIQKKEPRQIDLPGPGGTYEAAWLKAYLTRQEKIGEKKHPTSLHGEPADQDALINWLVALKPAKK